MRTLPSIKPPTVEPKLDQRWTRKGVVPLVTQIRQYELITPLFGGGVDPGVTDPVTLIRGTSIRGHLRFWWRATRGGQFDGCLSEMKKAEDDLWGTASTSKNPCPSKVQIGVDITEQGQIENPFETRTRAASGWQDVAYAAFPLQGDGKKPPGSVRSGIAFALRLSFPESDEDEITAALWAWETFGGVGARTRRGFGTLKLAAMDGISNRIPNPQMVGAWIESNLRTHVTTGAWPADVPHLSGQLCMKVTGSYPTPRSAWGYLLRKLKDFRQSRNPGTASNRPGRSHWPEPDEIRRLTSQSAPMHATPLSTVAKFPRAQFGLPIIFHFKDEKSGDPNDTSLEGVDHDRLTSPLILRPLACEGGRAVGLAVVLDGTSLPPGGLVLQSAGSTSRVDATLTVAEANHIKPLNSNPDVLQAFLNTL